MTIFEVFLTTFVTMFFIATVVVVIYGLPIFLRWLAHEDPVTGEKPLLFVTVREGEARNIEWNRKFHRSIMNYSGRCFAGKLDLTIPETDERYWEIVKDTRPPKKPGFFARLFNLPAYDGLYFLGPPFIANIPPYHMTWVEWDFVKDSSGRTSAEKGPISHDEPNMTHLMLKSDVYFVRVSAGETKDGTPVNMSVLFTIHPNNTYKPQYRVQDWLEAVTNQAETKIRSYIGMEDTLSILTVSAADEEEAARAQHEIAVAIQLSERSERELILLLSTSLERFRDEYGISVTLTQIQEVELAGEDAPKLRAALTAKFEANAAAERVRIAAEAEANRIRTIAIAEEDAVNRVLGAVARVPDGVEMYGDQQRAKMQNLTTLVIDKGGKKN